MPCMYNGQPVKGNKGACPYGTTWQDDTPIASSEDHSNMSLEELYALPRDALTSEDWLRIDAPVQNIGDWITPGAPLKAAQWGLGALAASPFIKGGYNILKKKATDPNNLKKLQNLKNRLFKRFDEPVRPPYPIMNKAQEAAWRKANPGKWLFDKWKLAGWGGGTGLTMTQLMDQMGGDAPVSKVDTEPSPPGYKGGREARAGRGPAPEPNAMQRLGANMKDPKWWHQSMSGLKGDTRLMRLGQLMDYYGKTPKQRADSTAPAELWAENEIAHGKNVAAAASGSDSTFLSKFSSEDQDLAIRESVRDKLGFSDLIPFNQSSEEELEQTVARVKGLIQEYVKKGMDWSDALTLAMSYVTK